MFFFWKSRHEKINVNWVFQLKNKFWCHYRTQNGGPDGPFSSHNFPVPLSQNLRKSPSISKFEQWQLCEFSVLLFFKKKINIFYQSMDIELTVNSDSSIKPPQWLLYHFPTILKIDLMNEHQLILIYYVRPHLHILLNVD